MEYRKFGNTIFARIDRGEEILEKLKEISVKENIKLAHVSALGATNDFTVGVFNVDEKKYYANSFSGNFEISDGNGHNHERRVLRSPAYERRQRQGRGFRRTSQPCKDQRNLRNGDNRCRRHSRKKIR